jgi:hypothetical protein
MMTRDVAVQQWTSISSKFQGLEGPFVRDKQAAFDDLA